MLLCPSFPFSINYHFANEMQGKERSRKATGRGGKEGQEKGNVIPKLYDMPKERK